MPSAHARCVLTNKNLTARAALRESDAIPCTTPPATEPRTTASTTAFHTVCA